MKVAKRDDGNLISQYVAKKTGNGNKDIPQLEDIVLL